ncbi:hypothetical protein ACLOJK_041109 [Asimina triloba]
MSLRIFGLCVLAGRDLFYRLLKVNLANARKSLLRLLLLFCVQDLADGRDHDSLSPSSSTTSRQLGWDGMRRKGLYRGTSRKKLPVREKYCIDDRD